jgi:AbrB family looped-hinge helix DNA binding protein
MGQVVLTTKGQMTLPKEVREDLQVGPGDRLDISKQGEGYLITRRKSAKELFAKYRPHPGKPLTIEEMNQAIEDEVWDRNKPKHDRR